MRILLLFLVFLYNTLSVLSGTVYRVTGIYSNSYLNIRSGAGTGYGVVGTLHNNDLLYVTSISNGWAKFYKGYVSSSYLAKASGPTKYTTNADLNFRTGPSTGYSIITTLKQGTAVNYYGRDPLTSGWAVTDNGYASANYLTQGGSNPQPCTNCSDKLKKAQNASDYARNHALAKSISLCLKYVDDALQYGGGFSYTRKNGACQMHTDGVLKSLGFTLLSGKPNPLKKGDVAVHGCNNSHPYGHIQIYDGSTWYSDFKQTSEYVYSSNSPPIYYYRIQA